MEDRKSTLKRSLPTGDTTPEACIWSVGVVMYATRHPNERRPRMPLTIANHGMERCIPWLLFLTVEVIIVHLPFLQMRSPPRGPRRA
jgi:hypothetical protein